MQTKMAQYLSAKIRKHTRDAMRAKAAKGWHTHGKVFGYDVVRIDKGHCELRKNEQEAKVVRDIYQRFAAGAGARMIAEALNSAKVPKPRAQQGRADGWSVSTIRAVLWRPLYRGEVVYGPTMKAYNRETPESASGDEAGEGPDSATGRTLDSERGAHAADH